MKTVFEILIVLNTVTTIFLLSLAIKKLHVRVHKEKTFYEDTVYAIRLSLWENFGTSYTKQLYRIVIPIRNEKRVKLKEEIHYLKNSTYQIRFQKLTSMFCWIKTPEEAKAFKKSYYEVDNELVEKLFNNFMKSI